MVGVAGFKPTTSPTPRVRANQAAPYSVKKDKSVIILAILLFFSFLFFLLFAFLQN